MNSIDPDKEQENILKILNRNSELYVREIHQRLVDMNESQFKEIPEVDYNDERRIIRALNKVLNENRDLITNEEGGDQGKWSLTKAGEKEAQRNF